MALVWANGVWDTSTTTGTGTYTLSGTAVVGRQTFGTGVGDGNSCVYRAEDDTNGGWEVGIGAYTASGTTLTRAAVLASSNSNNAVSWPSGTRQVFVCEPAALVGQNAQFVYQASHGFSGGNVLKATGATAFALAKADSAANAEVAGIVAAAYGTDYLLLALPGYYFPAGTFSGLTVGQVAYLSPSSAGALTTTEPSTAGQVSKPVLVADSATSGWFVNFRGEVIVTNTAHGVVVGTGTGSTSTAAMTDGQLLVGQTSADPLPKTVSGDATVAASGAISVTKTGGAAFVGGATVSPAHTKSTITNSTKTTTSATPVEIDSSLRVTVTVPASGKILVRQSLVVSGSATGDCSISVSADAGSNWTNAGGFDFSAGSVRTTVIGEVQLTGLTPGSLTLYMGWQQAGTITLTCAAGSFGGVQQGTWMSVLTLP